MPSPRESRSPLPRVPNPQRRARARRRPARARGDVRAFTPRSSPSGRVVARGERGAAGRESRRGETHASRPFDMRSTLVAASALAPAPRRAETRRRTLFACGVRLDGVRCALRRRGWTGETRLDGRGSASAREDGESVVGDASAVEGEGVGAGEADAVGAAGGGEEASELGIAGTRASGADGVGRGDDATEAARDAGGSSTANSRRAGETSSSEKRNGTSKMIVDSGRVERSVDEESGVSGTMRLRRRFREEETSVAAGGTIRKKVDPSRGVGVKRSMAREALLKVRREAADRLDNLRTNRLEPGASTEEARIAGEAVALAKVTADALRGTGPISMEEWSAAMSTALSAVWRELWYRWSQKLKQSAKWVLAISALLSAGFHYILGPAVVSPRLPMIGEVASAAVGRPVRVGRCKSLSFMGVLGFGKVLEVGPVVLGPSETEKSIVEVDSVKISYDILRSILRRKLVTEVNLEGVNATLRQGANNSWFGYPEDTNPLSSRPQLQLNPGSKKAKSKSPLGVELRVVRLERGNAKLHIKNDPEPRKLKNLQGKAVISTTGKIELDLTTNPETRQTPPTKRPTTMLAPAPVRHLRASQTPAEKRSLESEILRGTNGGQIRAFATYTPPQQRGIRARQYPELKVRAQLNNTSAAFIERVIPNVPIDVRGGRLDGEVRLTCNSQATWTFPDFGGQLKGKNLWFHFFDSTDDFADTDVDLVFEGQRMYMHGGEGYFGHVPLTVTGDLDLNSAGGEYRLSAQVRPVEVHNLRETLGVRPIPRPVAGTVKGFLYCSGPLDSPVFTGRAETTVPTPEDVNKAEPGTEMAWSEDAIKAAKNEGAVAAYDRVPFKSANAVFTADIKKGFVSLHSAEAVPVDGGKLRASGRISTKPNALFDPEALDVEGTGVDLDFLKLAKRFVPSGQEEPPWLHRICPSSSANVSGTFVGALSEPVLNANWAVDDEEYRGQLIMTREGVTTNVETPVLEMKASIATKFAPLEEQLMSTTIADAIRLGKPKVTDAEADLKLNGADVATWMVTEDAVDTPDRVRLRIGGRTRVKGKFTQPRNEQDEEIEGVLPTFSGHVQLDHLRVNKLEFAPKMTGKLKASESGVQLHAKSRADEYLETSVEQGGKAAINIRRNNLKISAEVDDFAGRLDVAGLLLDDLEIASLRGKVDAASAKIDLRDRTGTGALSLKQPRLSGISGESLKANIGWRGRVVSLERATLKQSKSQYDADGDYSLPDEVWNALPSERVLVSEENADIVEDIDLISLASANVEADREPIEQELESATAEEAPKQAEAVEIKFFKKLRIRRPAVLDRFVQRFKGAPAKKEAVAVQEQRVVESIDAVASSGVSPPDEQIVELSTAEEVNAAAEVDAPAAESAERQETVVEQRAEVADTTNDNIVTARDQSGDDAEQTNEAPKGALSAEIAAILQGKESDDKGRPKAAAKTIKSVLRTARNVVMSNKVEKEPEEKPRVELQSYENEFESATSGAWRFRLAVPQADIEEMLPVLRVITDLRKGATPEEYGRSKQAFLEGLENMGYAVVDLARQIDDVTTERKSESVVETEAAVSSDAKSSKEASKKLPGLQDLKGGWHGMIQATGGGDKLVGSSPQPTETVLFDIAGSEWQWGPYKVTRVEAHGEVNSKEGLKLKNLDVSSDAASLSVSGAIGGPKQDATFAVRDFPAPLLGAFVGPMLPDQAIADFPPISGDLLVQGHLGGSVTAPEGEFLMRLRDGKIGNVKLKSAELNAELNEARRAEFEGEAVPAVGSGLVRIAGAVPLPEASDQALAVDWRVREHGVTLLTAFVPELAEWQSGSADLSLHVRGTPTAPVYDGVMEIRKARILSPLLARPISSANATVRIQRNTLYVDDVEAKSGKGVVKIKGAMPILKPARTAGGETWEGLVARADTQGGVKVAIDGLDVRAKNVYSGQLNANIVAKGTVLAPELSGNVRVSRGTAFVQQQPPVEDVMSQENDKRGVLAGILERAARANDPNHGEGVAQIENELMNEKNLEKLQNFRLRGLQITVGPEMSVVYPFVMNFGVTGELTLDGAVNANAIRPNGSLQFDRGDVNLVATQIRLDRDHPNRVVFSPEKGLDPHVDMAFLGTDLRALIQGPASRWTDNLTLTSSAQATPGEGDTISPSEAARIFESQLVESLLEQDGKIAFSNLASTTLASLMPKIEAGGNVGKARWRLTAAPSLPGLLSLDPDLDPFSNTGSFTLGSEAEISFGDSLQATLSRNLDADEMRTELSLVYKLTKKLRMQLKSLSASATRVMFEFSTKD